jgi:uncharacterized protein
MTEATSTNPITVITGASTGIGRELAKQFAQHGHDLLLCADEEIPTDSLPGVSVQTVVTDLRTREGVETLYAAIDRPVEALVLNAGIGLGGAFLDQDVDAALSVVALNVTANVHLSRLVLPGMVERNSGRVLVLSSIAALMPGPYQAIYNASKSFLQSFTQALQTELSSTGVTLTSVLPGPTETDFFDRAGIENTKMGQGHKDDAAQVAAQSYQALMAGKRRVVGGGISTRAAYYAGTVLPDAVKAVMHSAMAKPRS